MGKNDIEGRARGIKTIAQAVSSAMKALAIREERYCYETVTKGLSNDVIENFEPYNIEFVPLRKQKSNIWPRISPNKKRPFIFSLPIKRKIEPYIYMGGKPAVIESYFQALGCKVFDGLCIEQGEWDEIDCAECIKSTFTAFIKGCKHREYYVDPHGTIRCVSCKAELGQMEDGDIYEIDDHPERDDFAELEPDGFLHCHRMRNHRTWNMEGKINQLPAE